MADVLSVSAVLGLAASIAPWVALTIGWRAAAATAGALAVGATTTFLIAEIYPPTYGVRLDYLLVPLLVLAWSNCLAFLQEARRRRSAQPAGRSGVFLSLILLADVLLLLMVMAFFFYPDPD